MKTPKQDFIELLDNAIEQLAELHTELDEIDQQLKRISNQPDLEK